MQPILYIEYFLGQRSWKRYGDLATQMFQSIEDLSRHLVLKELSTGMRFEIPSTHPSFELMQDPGFRNLVVSLNLYKEKQKNFVFSKYLSLLLRETRQDVECKFLHKELCGYIEMDSLFDKDGERIWGFLFDVRKVEGVWRIIITWVSDAGISPSINHFYHDLPEDKLISDVINAGSNTTSYILDGEIINEITPSKTYDYILESINAILYCMSKHGMEETLNEFAQKLSKKVGQQKVYTKLPFYHFDVPKEFRVTDIFVKAHIQRYHVGKGRTEIQFNFKTPKSRKVKI